MRPGWWKLFPLSRCDGVDKYGKAFQILWVIPPGDAPGCRCRVLKGFHTFLTHPDKQTREAIQSACPLPAISSSFCLRQASCSCCSGPGWPSAFPRGWCLKSIWRSLWSTAALFTNREFCQKPVMAFLQELQTGSSLET